ncbi:MAG: glutamine-hydrolyzing carbamoyl-phosphate synthase small subunit [bacterium]
MLSGLLILEDGTIMEGKGLGIEGMSYGELVFNTAMSGYEEAFTDPSYAGQILLMTYPLIGNYGFNSKYKESKNVRVRGLVLKEPAFFSSGNLKIVKYLQKNKLLCIWDIDTRQLTLKLRYFGTMKAMLVLTKKALNTALLLKKLKNMVHPHSQNLVAEVSCRSIIIHRSSHKKRVVLIDLGVKSSIIKNLRNYASVIQVPYNTDLGSINKFRPDGIVISNGPGDPEHPVLMNSTVKTIKGLIKKGYPIFGICLGHQLLGIAFGLKTYKLKFGHRGCNHPVKCLWNNRIYITSQNHGYALKSSDKNKNIVFDWVNLNDGTVEGMRHCLLPIFSVQFHPEASPGPYDTKFLFDKFNYLLDAQTPRY